MFKKTILTISALALSAGMLVSASSDAEAGVSSRYVKTNLSPSYGVLYDGLTPSHQASVRRLIERLSGQVSAPIYRPRIVRPVYTTPPPMRVPARPQQPGYQVAPRPATNNTLALNFSQTEVKGNQNTQNIQPGGKGVQQNGANAHVTLSGKCRTKKCRKRLYRVTRYRRTRGRIIKRRISKSTCLRAKRCRALYYRMKRKMSKSRYRVTRRSGRRSYRSSASIVRSCFRKSRCRNAVKARIRSYARRDRRKARYIPTRYKRKLALKKRRALKRRRLLRKRRALRRSRYLPTRYKRKAAAKRRALKRRRILRKRRALKRSKYKRTSYRGRRHLRRRVR